MTGQKYCPLCEPLEDSFDRPKACSGSCGNPARRAGHHPVERQKEYFGEPMSPELLEELATSCDAVITGVGD